MVFPRTTIEKCIELATERGGFCLSKREDVVDQNSKIEWKCDNNKHPSFKTSYKSVKRGSWCRLCFIDSRKRDLKYCQELAKEHNGICISTEYINNATKMEWKCDNPKHEPFFMLIGSVKQGKWCWQCESDNKRFGIEKCREYAVKRGFECLSEEYIDNNQILLWRCSFGHVWEARLRCVKDAGSGCPECSGKMKKTIYDCIKLAESFGGELISTEYTNTSTKLEWMCKEGHIFTAKYNSVYNGHWCPKCNKAGNVVRNKITSILEGIFPDQEILVDTRPFDWLVGKTGMRLEIDFYIPSISLAIEYDGKQHFEPVSFGGDEEKAIIQFQDTKQRDLLKDHLIAAHPHDVQHFLRIPYTATLTEESIKVLLNQVGLST